MPNGKEIRMDKTYFEKHMPKSNIKYHPYGVSGDGYIHPDDIDKIFSRHSRKVKTIFDTAKKLYKEYEGKNWLGLPETVRDLVWIQHQTAEEEQQSRQEDLRFFRSYELGVRAVAA
jgi:hypothetical protein